VAPANFFVSLPTPLLHKGNRKQNVRESGGYTMTKYVYKFKEGNASMKNLLGGKGANLAEMTGLGLPVPRGFTITTEACNRYYDDNKTIAPEIEKEIFDTLAATEAIVGKKLGDPADPYLVSVRSGARASMPGASRRSRSRTPDCRWRLPPSRQLPS
jgi:hypothetical protein